MALSQYATCPPTGLEVAMTRPPSPAATEPM
ncbi:Uncharacterised protein [Bordetella pertussis]|nr:Uncharacterised protein [Bordetella pertussis]